MMLIGLQKTILISHLTSSKKINGLSESGKTVFLSKENHAIVAWLKRGIADEQKRNIRESDKNSYIEERKKLAENSRG